MREDKARSCADRVALPTFGEHVRACGGPYRRSHCSCALSLSPATLWVFFFFFSALEMPARPSYDARLPYATVSGHEIHLEVYLPKDKQGPVPVLAWFHGGGGLQTASQLSLTIR